MISPHQVTSLSSVSSAEEKLNESSRGILGSFSFASRRASGGGNAGMLGSFSMGGGGGSSGGDTEAANLAATQEAELEEFLASTCGMKHMVGRFMACGVHSVSQLCAELNSPAITDAVIEKQGGVKMKWVCSWVWGEGSVCIRWWWVR